MIKGKRGNAIKIVSAIIGSALFMTALYFLNNEQITQAAIFGMIGVILISISFLPFIRSV